MIYISSVPCIGGTNLPHLSSHNIYAHLFFVPWLEISRKYSHPKDKFVVVQVHEIGHNFGFVSVVCNDETNVFLVSLLLNAKQFSCVSFILAQ